MHSSELVNKVLVAVYESEYGDFWNGSEMCIESDELYHRVDKAKSTARAAITATLEALAERYANTDISLCAMPVDVWLLRIAADIEKDDSDA